MNKVKVEKVFSDGILFDNGMTLESYHCQDCCESHYLDFSNIPIAEFAGLEFDLTSDDFFERVEDFGIALKPDNNFPVRVPGYGNNNGYYSSDLSLRLVDKSGKVVKEWDITECQVVEG